MQETSSRRVKHIETSEAAEILVNPANLRVLRPFWGEERSITEAATIVGVKPNTLLKQVRRLEAAGLVTVTRLVPRSGRAVKLYRTVADCFFVPYQATTAGSLEEAMAHKEAYFEDLFRRSLVAALEADLSGWGLRIYRDEAGLLKMFPTPHVDRDYSPLVAGHPATYSAWYDDLELDFADAKALQRELHALYGRYRGRRGGQRYLLRLGVTPIV